MYDQSSNSLSAPFSQTNPNDYVSIDSSTESHSSNLHYLDIVALLNENSATSNGTFTITITNPCTTDTITQVGSINDITYYMGDTTT